MLHSHVSAIVTYFSDFLYILLAYDTEGKGSRFVWTTQTEWA